MYYFLDQALKPIRNHSCSTLTISSNLISPGTETGVISTSFDSFPVVWVACNAGSGIEVGIVGARSVGAGVEG